MKKYFLGLLCALLLPTAMLGETISSVLSTNGVANLLSQGVVIYKITVANASGATSNVKLFDSATAAVTNVIGAYTNYTITNGNVTNIFTNILNIAVTNVYSNVLIQTAQNVPQTTNNQATIVALTVPNNTTSVSSPVNPYFAFKGVTVTNDAVATITIEYAPFK